MQLPAQCSRKPYLRRSNPARANSPLGAWSLYRMKPCTPSFQVCRVSSVQSKLLVGNGGLDLLIGQLDVVFVNLTKLSREVVISP